MVEVTSFVNWDALEKEFVRDGVERVHRRGVARRKARRSERSDSLRTTARAVGRWCCGDFGSLWLCAPATGCS